MIQVNPDSCRVTKYKDGKPVSEEVIIPQSVKERWIEAESRKQNRAQVCSHLFKEELANKKDD